jgi:hypothetical protein
MLRFSVRAILLYTVFACVLLAFTRMPFEVGCSLLLIGIAVANILVPTGLWRHAVYGGIAGIVAGIVALSFYLNVIISAPHTYTDGRTEVVYRTRPYVVQMGALLGGTVGIIIRGARSK